jgi:hypothetical protein
MTNLGTGFALRHSRAWLPREEPRILVRVTQLAPCSFFIDLGAMLPNINYMNLFQRKLTVLLMGLAVCMMANGCFSCSYRSQQANPYPNSSSSSSTSMQATVP